jgi:mRNA interferase RelE/StbE
MKVKIDRSFEKDTDKIKDRKLLSKLAACIEQVTASRSITDIKILKNFLVSIISIGYA